METGPCPAGRKNATKKKMKKKKRRGHQPARAYTIYGIYYMH